MLYTATLQEQGNDEIISLSDKNFWIPAYQRGYRWTETEVEALLDDIKEFKSENDSWYCLQPIVVKENKDVYNKLVEQGRRTELTPNDTVYELIDGQQRLTTVYIVMQCIAESIGSISAEVAKQLRIDIENVSPADYRLIYETRHKSETFLKEWEEDPQENPDFYFMSEARETVTRYLDNAGVVEMNDIYKKLTGETRFIWYDVTNIPAKPIEVFQKLNMGKIPLSSSELIKAVLLNTRLFEHSSELDEKLKRKLSPEMIENEVKKLQYKRSLEWDSIEYSLNEPNFWGFLSNEPLKGEPCMELIFDTIARNFNSRHNYEIQERSTNFSFLVIYHHLSKNEDMTQRANDAKEIWDMAEKKHSKFKEWFQDDELYHLIGYLLACRPLVSRKATWTAGKLDEEMAVKEMKRSEVREFLIGEIKKSIDVETEAGMENIGELSLGNDNDKIRNVLLLFNIVTILSPLYGDEARIKTDMRFPFYIFKEMKWDLEHIHAKKNSEDDNEVSRDSIENLTLLDEKTNSGYKHAPFDEKRTFIKDKEKEGRFIPVCTQNVFNKKYTEQTSSDGFAKWEEDNDGVAYVEELKTTISKFLFKEVAKNE